MRRCLLPILASILASSRRSRADEGALALKTFTAEPKPLPLVMTSPLY